MSLTIKDLCYNIKVNAIIKLDAGMEVKETILDRFKKDVEWNSKHPLCSDVNDETFGRHKDGRFCVPFIDKGDIIVHYIFDNGHHYKLNATNKMLYKVEDVSIEYMIPHYIQKKILDFSVKYDLKDQEECKREMVCNKYEINAMPLIRILLHRQHQHIVEITNILIPFRLHGNGIGKKLIKEIFNICNTYGYRLFLLDLVDSFKESLKRRNAIIFDWDNAEITEFTKLD